MKRILCSALALVLALSLCACGESGGDTGPTYPAAFAGLETQIDAAREEGRLTVARTGEIDHHCAKAYIQAIAAKIEAYMPSVCVLDFREVSFVDSSGIAVVINALRSMTQIEGQLLLTGIAPQPMRVFRASGIDKLVEIREAVS